jgi:hypothetical protein
LSDRTEKERINAQIFVCCENESDRYFCLAQEFPRQ